jgi:hypothetical protein
MKKHMKKSPKAKKAAATAKAKPAPSAKARTQTDDPKLLDVPAAPAKRLDLSHARKDIELRHEQILIVENEREFDEEEEGYIRNELMPSIAARGVLDRPWVYKLAKPQKGKTHGLIAGERRWRAVGYLIEEQGREDLRVLKCQEIDCPRDAIADYRLIENLQRKDLNFVEQAEGFRRAIERGNLVPWDEKNPERSLGHRLGLPKSVIYGKLKIPELPKLALDAGPRRAVERERADPPGAHPGQAAADGCDQGGRRGPMDRRGGAEAHQGRLYARAEGGAV